MAQDTTNRYVSNKPLILQNASFAINPGQQSPIDLRLVVPSLTVLQNPLTWKAEWKDPATGNISKSTEDNYYIGMLVYVESEKAVYSLVDANVDQLYSQTQHGWKIVDVDTSKIVGKTSYTVTTADGAEQKWTGNLRDLGYTSTVTTPLFSGTTINPIYLSSGASVSVLYSGTGTLASSSCFKNSSGDTISPNESTVYVLGAAATIGDTTYPVGTQFMYNGTNYYVKNSSSGSGDADMTWKAIYNYKLNVSNVTLTRVAKNTEEYNIVVKGSLSATNYSETAVVTAFVKSGDVNVTNTFSIPAQGSYSYTLSDEGVIIATGTADKLSSAYTLVLSVDGDITKAIGQEVQVTI